MYSPPRQSITREPPQSQESQRFWKKQHNENAAKRKQRETQDARKNCSEKGDEMMRIVRHVQKVGRRHLPLALTSVYAFESGRRDCDTCNVNREAYKKIMRTLNLVDILASRAIEKEQTDMFEQVDRPAGNVEQKEDRPCCRLSVFCERSEPVIDHSLKCILINLQNNLAYLIMQIGFVKTRGKETKHRFKNMDVSLNDFQTIRFECTALTDKVITLLNGVSASSGELHGDAGVCVGCVKQELAGCNQQLERLLDSCASLVLVMRNDRPGHCCQRNYPHIHAQVHGQPVVLKYRKAFTKGIARDKSDASTTALPGSRFHKLNTLENAGNHEDDPNSAHIEKDGKEPSNLKRLFEAESPKTGSVNNQFDQQQRDHRNSYRQSVFSISIPAEKENNPRMVQQSEADAKGEEFSIYDDPKGANYSELPDLSADPLAISSHSKSNLSSTVMHLHKVDDNIALESTTSQNDLASPKSKSAAPHTDTSHSAASPQKASISKSSKIADPRSSTLDTKPRSRASSTVSKLDDSRRNSVSRGRVKQNSEASSQNKPRISTKTLSKVESDNKTNKGELGSLTQNPRTDTLSSQKSHQSKSRNSSDKGRPVDSQSPLKVESVMTVNMNDKLTSTLNSRTEVSRRYSSSSRSSSQSSSESKLSRAESTSKSYSEYSSSTGFSDKSSEKESKQTNKQEEGRRQSRISHVSFKESVTEASIHDSGSFPSYLLEVKDDKRRSDSRRTNEDSKIKEDGPFAKSGDAPVYMVAMDSIILNKQKLSHASVKASKQLVVDPQPPDTAIVNAYKKFLDETEYERKVTEPKRRGGDGGETAKKRNRTVKTKTSKKVRKESSEKIIIEPVKNENKNDVTNDENKQTENENKIAKSENKKYESVLDFLGRDRLLNVIRPADCCLDIDLEKEYEEISNIPLRPSLDSLPLSRSDLLYLAQKLEMEVDPDQFKLVEEDESQIQEWEWEKKLEEERNAEDKTKWQRAVGREEAQAAAKARHIDLYPSMPTIKEEPSNFSLEQKAKSEAGQRKSSNLPVTPRIPIILIKEERRGSLGNKTPPPLFKRHKTTELRYFTVEFPLDIEKKAKSPAQNPPTTDLSANKTHSPKKPESSQTVEASTENFHSCHSALNKFTSEASKLTDSCCSSLREINEMIMLNVIYLDSSKDDNHVLKDVWQTPLSSFPKLSEEDFERKISESQFISLKKGPSEFVKVVDIENRLDEPSKENKALMTSNFNNEKKEDLDTALRLFDGEGVHRKYHTAISNGENLNLLNEKAVIGKGDTREIILKNIPHASQRFELNKSYTIFRGHQEDDCFTIMKNLQLRKGTDSRNIMNLKRPHDMYTNKIIKAKNNTFCMNQNEIVPIKKARIESSIPPIGKQGELKLKNNIEEMIKRVTKKSHWHKLRTDNINVKNYIAKHKNQMPEINKITAKHAVKRNRKPLVLRHASVKYWRFEFHVTLPKMQFAIVKLLLSNIQIPVIVCKEKQKPKVIQAVESSNKGVRVNEIGSQKNNKSTEGQKSSVKDQIIRIPSERTRLNCSDELRENEAKCDLFNGEDKCSTLIVVPLKSEADRPFLKRSKKTTDCSVPGNHIKASCKAGGRECETRLVDSSGRPLFLFDADGRPLTDRSGRLLSDMVGRTMAVVDSSGTPVSDCDGGVVHDSEGRAPNEAGFDPTRSKTSKSRILKTLMSTTGEPLRLYDRRGRPLTSPSGTVLADASGQDLIRCSGGGRPCADCTGGPLYDQNGERIVV